MRGWNTLSTAPIGKNMAISKDNPAVFECSADRQSIHTWTRHNDGTARCNACRTYLTVEQTAEVWHGWNTDTMIERHTTAPRLLP